MDDLKNLTMKHIKIPESIVSEFVEVSAKNFSRECGHIETLAFLVGYRNGNDVIATD